MIVLDRLTLFFIGLCTTFLLVMAVQNPVDHATTTPRAEFLPMDEVPEVTSVNSLDYRFRQNGMYLSTASSLMKAFSNVDYDLMAVRAGRNTVPRFFVTSLPSDMRRIRVAERKKEIFFQSVLPLILRVNYEIQNDRKRLIRLKEKRLKRLGLQVESRLWLAAMEDKYKVKRGGLNRLIERMDIIPPSLALAQAAEESGWGTSRFVTEGNALFGQWTVDGDKGFVPAGRTRGRTHRVKAFSTLLEAVRAYVLNLNTHNAYRVFRLHRLKARRTKRKPSGRELSKYLYAYSERGDRYIKNIQKIISVNNLEGFDEAKLSKVAKSSSRILAAKEPAT